MNKNPRNLSVYVQAEIHPSADELADVFWAMDAEEQAHFFNRLGAISGGKLPFQLQNVTDHPLLETQGRHAMSMIGDYARPTELEAALQSSNTRTPLMHAQIFE